MSIGEPEVSVIIPFYNEEENVEDTLRTVSESLSESGLRSWELILVNDGSTDSTRTLLQKWTAQYRSATIVNHDRNLGVGAALRNGVGHARGKKLVTIEGDLTYDPRDIVRLTKEIDKGYDLVIGSPYAKGGSVGGVAIGRRVISKFGNLLLARSSGLGVSCVTNSFRAYRSNLGHLFVMAQHNDKRLHPTILMLANLSKLRIKEIPVVLHPRKRGKSKTRLSGAVLAHTGLLLSFLRTRIREASTKKG